MGRILEREGYELRSEREEKEEKVEGKWFGLLLVKQLKQVEVSRSRGKFRILAHKQKLFDLDQKNIESPSTQIFNLGDATGNTTFLLCVPGAPSLLGKTIVVKRVFKTIGTWKTVEIRELAN